MENLKKLIWIIMMFGMVSLVQGISCTHDTAPYLTKTIDWLCEVDYNSTCYGMIFVSGINGTLDMQNLVSVSPKPYYVEDIGVIDYFDGAKGLVSVQFDKKILLNRVTYNFTVVCDSPEDVSYYSQLVTPVYSGFKSLPPFFIFIKENMTFVVAILFVVLIILGFIFILKNVI